MNRRNFVVGLGTVATISGVASVTSAAFSGDSVTPTTNFQIVPENAQLVVQRLSDNIGSYSNMASSNDSWVDSEITDFANITSEQGSPVVAHVNTSENNNLGAQLAFNNSNDTTYDQYTYDTVSNSQNGFFEIANLGDTDEDVSIEFTYSDRVGSDPTTDGTAATEPQVAGMFAFQDEDGNVIGPDSDDATAPLNEVNIPSGTVETIGLQIDITPEVYDNIQEEAGGAFSETEGSIRLLESIEVGVDSDNVRNPN